VLVGWLVLVGLCWLVGWCWCGHLALGRPNAAGPLTGGLRQVPLGWLCWVP